MGQLENSKVKLLAVDDDPAVISFLRDLLINDPEIEVIGAGSGKEAIDAFKANPRQFGGILMDYGLLDMTGADATVEILKLNPDQIVMMNSGDESREAAIMSWRAGAVDFIEKRWDRASIRRKILSCVQKYREISGQSEKPATEFASEVIKSFGMVGASPEFAIVCEKAKRASASDAPVLIIGESGVGKDEIARAIHKNSKRSNLNFVSENLTAIPSELFESTLFGHVKGAFTGALHDNQGLLRKAHCGTLFLDEIGDLKLENQVKLLRVLQQGEFYPLGSNKLEKVNVRIIAATNVNLKLAIAEKRFREDLYFRLNTFEIEVPPLRQRPEDIRPLIIHFKSINNYQGRSLPLDVIKKFERYSWPGNVRELFSELTKLFEYFKDQPQITLKHLDAKFFESNSVGHLKENLMSMIDLKNKHQAEEISLIKLHLKKYKNIRDTASEGLKIPYTTLFSKLKSLKLVDEEIEK
jgi:DNA-binding NtrC family response regulator